MAEKMQKGNKNEGTNGKNRWKKLERNRKVKSKKKKSCKKWAKNLTTRRKKSLKKNEKKEEN